MNSHLSLDHPTISFLHLRIYVIEYDAKDCIPPLVYAQNLSRNGTRVTRLDYAELSAPQEFKLRKGDPPVLLTHGDVMEVGSEDAVQYFSRDADKIAILQLSPHKHAERKVCRRVLDRLATGKIVVLTLNKDFRTSLYHITS